jgi:hypothetical protein
MFHRIREHILERHNFYVEQVQRRILSQFPDIESEAEEYANNEYQRLASAPAREDVDLSDIAEYAHDRATEHYELLSDLKKQTLLGAIAGVYHQWDKELRDFVERELTHDVQDPEKHAWHDNMFELLTHFGWDVRSRPFFPKIDACRLVVNVYKHGNGPSLTQLGQRYPKYLRDPFAKPDEEASLRDDFLHHEWLEVSATDLNDFAAGFRSFWEEFPERLFLDPTRLVASGRDQP